MKDVKQILKYMGIGIVGFLALEFTYEVTVQTFKNVSHWHENKDKTLEQAIKELDAKTINRTPASK
jgi:hypothetical protein